MESEMAPEKRHCHPPSAVRWVLLAAGLVSLVVGCRPGAPRVTRAPEVEGATFVGNPACYDCHTNIHRIFNGSPHSRIYVSDLAQKGEAVCEACHGPGSKHVQAGGGRNVFIVNPGRQPTACLECHFDVRMDFQLPYHHAVLEGAMNCVQCHDPHGLDIFKPAGGLAFARRDESCRPCHQDQTRPFVFVHEALREGCAACHNPHGSVNDKMLQAPDNNLCLRCHAQTAGAGNPAGSVLIGATLHSSFLSQGTCWSSGCHTAVHGSNVDPKLRY